MSAYWVYILTNKPRSTLYVGVTNDLVRRIYEHREGLVKGFTQRYKLEDAGALRAVRFTGGGDSTREEHQALVSCLEA